jgi:hypothetical protein
MLPTYKHKHIKLVPTPGIQCPPFRFLHHCAALMSFVLAAQRSNHLAHLCVHIYVKKQQASIRVGKFASQDVDVTLNERYSIGLTRHKYMYMFYSE